MDELVNAKIYSDDEWRKLATKKYGIVKAWIKTTIPILQEK